MSQELANMTPDDWNRQPMPVKLYGIYDGSAMAEIMTFDPLTADGGRMFIEATLGEPCSIKQVTNLPILLTNFYANKVSKTLTDGEVEEWCRIVLFTEDGKAYSCGSRGVAKSLYVLARMRPNLPWHPPIRATVKIRDLNDGKQWIVLEPDFTTIMPPTQNRGKGK